MPKFSEKPIDIQLEVGNNYILNKYLKRIFLISFHSFTIVRSVKAFGSPCASGELLKSWKIHKL